MREKRRFLLLKNFHTRVSAGIRGCGRCARAVCFVCSEGIEGRRFYLPVGRKSVEFPYKMVALDGEIGILYESIELDYNSRK